MALSKDIKDQIKDWDGIRRAKLRSYTWFDSVYGDRDDLTVEPLKNGLMHLGKIHKFRYRPKHRKTLPFYDKDPVVLMLGTTRGNDGILEVGINLNFLPKEVRFYLLNTIERVYKGAIDNATRSTREYRALNQKSIRMNYDRIKMILNMYGLGLAIRKYYPQNRKFTGVICFEEWKKASLLLPRPYQFVGISSFKIKNRYIEYVNKKR